MNSYKQEKRNYKMRKPKQIKKMKNSGHKSKLRRKWPTNVCKVNFRGTKLKRLKNFLLKMICLAEQMRK